MALALDPDGSLRLSPADAQAVRKVWVRAGQGYQVAVGAIDGLGRLVDATGVVVQGP